ncbi:hypothetical protein CDN99_22270 [Roseateles aquatilis]|uniref:Ribonuclease VapC n=1 Tax=Roseateles aquatilis TaxID=431061 RepID=A0A2D0AM33_9BURK|nr:type II toxin-antitoxin system VapC family toxin [Roseateles aquatilis]OWQ85269.1 hypothetical protein CDN99_22270 [Roseateles aquatilis]
MTTIVVDASAALGWMVLSTDSEAVHQYSSRLADAALSNGAQLIAPYVFNAECAHAMLKRSRAEAWPRNRIEAYAELIDLYEVGLDDDILPLPEHVDWAVQHHVQGYDALYLALAIERGAKLATTDRGLRAAAERAGVELF